MCVFICGPESVQAMKSERSFEILAEPEEAEGVIDSRTQRQCLLFKDSVSQDTGLCVRVCLISAHKASDLEPV